MFSIRRGPALLLTTLVMLALVQPLAFAATGAPSSGSDPVVAEDRTGLELAAEAYMLQAHNQQRLAGGTRNGSRHNDVTATGAMQAWTDIGVVARRWSDRLSFDDFYHNPNYHNQYGHRNGYAENIVIVTVKSARNGQPTKQEVLDKAEHSLQLWWDSTGHRRNWMNPNWDHFSIGVAISKQEYAGHDYWVMRSTANFRRHDGSTISSPHTAYPTDGSLPPNESDATTPSTWTGSTPPAGAVPLVGDWDGDGDEDLGWYHRARVVLGLPGDVLAFSYGRPGDVPIVGDWDGDGIDTVSVIRDRIWHLNNRHGGGDAYRSFVYGRLTRGDLPLVGDWNGDGRDGIGIVRDGEWHLRNDQSGGPGRIVFIYGRVLRGDVPIIGDWNGDGRDTIGIVRSADWHLRDALAGGAADRVVRFGRASDLPVAGDFDGDGATTTGAVRGADWYLRNDLRGGTAKVSVRFGM